MATHLRTICEAEEITVSDVALRLIARAGEGSVRDSVALLDQMATFGSGTITDDDAKKLLGGLDSAIFQKLSAAILAGDHGPILEIVADIEANGWDPHNVYSQFLAFCRDALHLILGAPAESVDLPEEEQTALREALRPFGYEALLQVMQLLITSEGMVRRSELGLLALEIAWLRAAELPKVQRIEEFLAGRRPLPSGPDPQSPSGPSSPGRSVAGSLEARSPTPPTRSIRGDFSTGPSSPKSGEPEKPTAESRRTSDPTPTRDERGIKKSLTLDASQIPALLEVISSRRQSLAAHLRGASMSVAGSVLKIHPPSGATLLQRALERASNSEALDQVVIETWGAGATWELDASTAFQAQSPSEPAGPTSSFSAPPQSEPASIHGRSSRRDRAEQTASGQPDPFQGLGSALSKQELDTVAALPTVRSVLEIFGGTIRNIEPLDGAPPSEIEEQAS